MNKLKIKDIVYSVSETHPFNFEKLYAINTSDVFQGKIINTTMISTDELKGQFKKTIQSNDILFSEIRPINKHFAKVNLTDTKRYVVSTKLMVLRKHNINVDLDYFYYCLTNNVFLKILQSRAENRICSFPQITFDLLGEYSIPIPEMRIQKQIAKTIKNIDSKIEFNNKINDELENMAKTIYDYWFLQFEFPNEEGKPYKSSGGKMVWNDELKREIPEGWINGLISDLGEIISGGTPSTKHDEYYSKNGIAWVTPYDLSKTTDKYITHGEKDISQKGLEKSSAKLMPKGSILLTSRAPIGYIGISSNEVTTNQGFKSIVPYNKSNSEYIYYLLKSIIPYLKSLGNGSTFAEISKETLSNIPIVIPNKDIIDNFNNKVIHLGKIREIKEQENRELTSLRDFLLPLLMNGQVGFKEDKAEG